ncbi:Transcriptional regulator WhiB4 [Streptomyces chartreusis NRRL 3882]|uniref:Transcriptional regulator WhiB4 n=1 Tax=Streptomyces chartreusis NRRL 3882 TaxID=1079985 RepID=A0A2N9AZW2_STRCX|nr:Transcriptional regulator WhiB4 [Streptomyces chartreusis NRRL 3882]
MAEAAQNRAKAVCTGCPVRTECLADALDNRVKFGVWGGMTARERRALLRRLPTVTSWRRLLETARTEYERGVGTLTLDDDTVEPVRRVSGLKWRRPEDELAFLSVYKEQIKPLVGLLINAGASKHDAEDAAQSALEELAKKWYEVARPKPWLRTTASRMWLRAVRRVRPDELTDSVPEEGVVDHSADVVEKTDMNQLLRRLPPLQRMVMAFQIDGCSPSETAEALRMPAVNVRQNLRRARLNLARMLEEDEGGTQ